MEGTKKLTREDVDKKLRVYEGIVLLNQALMMIFQETSKFTRQKK